MQGWKFRPNDDISVSVYFYSQLDMDAENLKSVAQETVNFHKTDLHELSNNIWRNPELSRYLFSF